MQTLNLPNELLNPTVVSGRVVYKVMQDLTVYLVGPSEHELEHLIDLYVSICPPDRLVKYKISEIEFWPRITEPVLTASGRSAAIAGLQHPYFEPVRQRIRDGRAFEAGFWDSLEIDEPDGSWSFRCHRIHLRSKGLYAFVRILIPLQSECEILRVAALAMADKICLYSGHGGLVFVYDAWLQESALDGIYAQARRFWGVDVENLNQTLPLVKKGIKGVNWITMVGKDFSSSPEIEVALNDLANDANVTIEQRKHANVLIAGAKPVAGDQHRPDHSLDPYYAVANALKPLFLKDHPDFPSERFIANGNTVGWIRRFIEPDGWR